MDGLYAVVTESFQATKKHKVIGLFHYGSLRGRRRLSRNRVSYHMKTRGQSYALAQFTSGLYYVVPFETSG